MHDHVSCPRDNLHYLTADKTSEDSAADDTDSAYQAYPVRVQLSS
jgi:hypothetical protein